jgi:hypothetical protein
MKNEQNPRKNKLRLDRETVVPLKQDEMAGVHGGLTTIYCSTVTFFRCTVSGG